MKLLCIGGACAGRYMEIHESYPTVRGYAQFGDRFKTIEYKRERIHFSKETQIEFLIPSDWEPVQAFNHLLESYKEAHAQPIQPPII